MKDRLLTTCHVAEYLGFFPETVLRRYRAGKLEINIDPTPAGVEDRLRDPRVVELLYGDVERALRALDELDDHCLEIVRPTELRRAEVRLDLPVSATGQRQPPVTTVLSTSVGGRRPTDRWIKSTGRGWEHAFVTAQGQPLTRFRGALERRHILGAELAAREMGYASLRDALGLLSLYAGEQSPKYEKAATRWPARLAPSHPRG